MTTGTDDGEERNLAEAGVGEGERWRGVKSKCLKTRLRKSEREVGHDCITNTQRNEKGEMGHGCLLSTRPDAGRIYCRRDMYDTCTLQKDG